MWHGLACFGQWQGCSSKGIQGCSFAYYPADSGRAPLSNRHAAFLLTVLSVFFFSLLSCFVIGRLRPDWHCSRCAFDEACPWTSRGAARSRFVFLLIIDGYPFFIGLHVFARCVCLHFSNRAAFELQEQTAPPRIPRIPRFTSARWSWQVASPNGARRRYRRWKQRPLQRNSLVVLSQEPEQTFWHIDSIKLTISSWTQEDA